MARALCGGVPITQPYDVLKAAEQARSAIRRGDLNAAERWYRIAERATAIATRLAVLEREEKLKQWRPPRGYT